MNGCDNCEKRSACEDAVCDKKRVNCPFFKNLLNIVYEDDYLHYVVNGEAFYSVVNGEIVLQRVTDESYAYEVNKLADLVEGEFLPYDVEHGQFYMEPGTHCDVFVDGYLSNISFSDSETPYEIWPDCQHSGESSACFGESLWEKLCSEHVVQINAEGIWVDDCDDVVRHHSVKGKAFYSVVNDEIVLQRVTDERFDYEVHKKLIDGKYFVIEVEFGSFCMDSGTHCDVIVDGYLSNISFSYCERPYELRPGCEHPGESRVCFGDSLWKKLCSEHVVKVNAEGTWVDDRAKDGTRRYLVNGEAFYSVVNGEIVLQRVTDERYFYDVYDLIDGERFLKYDQEGYWEGSLCDVLVDGYVSNIGLCSNCGLPYQEGPYYLTLGDSLWEKLCSEHIVEVNWANK